MHCYFYGTSYFAADTLLEVFRNEALSSGGGSVAKNIANFIFGFLISAFCEKVKQASHD